MGPSEHLDWSELACHDGTPYPSAWEDRAETLASCFETIRVRCGDRPIGINSGYRTEAYNAALKGAAAHSFHIQGMALDLACPDGFPFTDFFAAVLETSTTHPIRGVGVDAERRMIHIDIRPSSVLKIWWYRNGEVQPGPETPMGI